MLGESLGGVQPFPEQSPSVDADQGGGRDGQGEDDAPGPLGLVGEGPSWSQVPPQIAQRLGQAPATAGPGAEALTVFPDEEWDGDERDRCGQQQPGHHHACVPGGRPAWGVD